MLGELRMNPFLNRDNCELVDVDAAIAELMLFVELGGQTVVDPTNLGIGRDPRALQRISRRTGLNIVMGAGFYLEPSHPAYVRGMSVDAVAHCIARDCGGDRRRHADRCRRHHRRDRHQQGLHRRGGEGAARRRAGLAAYSGVPLSIHLPAGSGTVIASST